MDLKGHFVFLSAVTALNTLFQKMTPKKEHLPGKSWVMTMCVRGRGLSDSDIMDRSQDAAGGDTVPRRALCPPPHRGTQAQICTVLGFILSCIPPSRMPGLSPVLTQPCSVSETWLQGATVLWTSRQAQQEDTGLQSVRLGLGFWKT